MGILYEQMISHFEWTHLLEFFLRILLAGICGAAIGLERAKRLKEAGIRTHILVCIGAALMMIVSKYAFADLAVEGGGFFPGIDGADASRIASQVVTGISFLGAGIIFKNGASVKGLTTAAGIWATAGIGLGVGAGLYIVSVFTTAVIMIIQVLLHRFAVGNDALVTQSFIITVTDSARFRAEFEQHLREVWCGQITDHRVTKGSNESTTFSLSVRMPKKVPFDDIVDYMESHPYITRFDSQLVG